MRRFKLKYFNQINIFLTIHKAMCDYSNYLLFSLEKYGKWRKRLAH